MNAASVETAEAAPAGVATVRQALDRLEAMIDHETDALRHNRPLDFAQVNELKSRMLLQLTRATRALPPQVRDDELGRHTVRVREKLEQNRELLQIHLRAEQQIGEILGKVLRDAESDGTYSAATGRSGPAR